MEIIKKNIFSVICGVVALVAIIASFWPLGSKTDELQTTLNGRKSAYESISSLLNKSRNLPIVDPQSSEQEPLKNFPSPDIIEKGKTATKEVSEESRKMLMIAEQINQQNRQLLVENELPRPHSTDQIRFQQAYGGFFTDMQSKMHGGTPPTAEQIKTASEQLWAQKFQPRIFNTNGVSNEQQVKAQYEDEMKRLPDALKTQIAQNSMVYVDPAAFDINTTITNAAAGSLPPESPVIFWAQIGMWIQQDVANAISETNKSAANVIAAPVKRLRRMEMPKGFVTNFKQGDNNQPMAGGSLNGPLPRVKSVSATGRVSNPLFDVAHFTITVDVDAEQIPAFLRELNKNRFLTVLRTDLASVDSGSEQAAGYVYGDKPVVTLTLTCETLFMRSWLTKLMPESIKASLGIMPQQPISG
ncbi:MAG: hypothetical protein IT447_11890 [Phycisphaerales bacterium]|jgi:hypothetical protein|nr:hypothetical protein [Phycisphaerales bacterium]